MLSVMVMRAFYTGVHVSVQRNIQVRCSLYARAASSQHTSIQQCHIGRPRAQSLRSSFLVRTHLNDRHKLLLTDYYLQSNNGTLIDC